ncbi:MAG: PEP/pyruvate-binding domain-containing protein [Candidatus Limnocylindrales bacterium]
MTETSMTALARAADTHGAKAANLAWLLEHGYRVPEGVVLREPDADALAAWITAGQRYAVRSSASVEDRADHSFAGQFTSLLGVEGLTAILEAIEQVRGSVHDERLAPYLEHAGVAPESIEMHVIVQHMVPAVAAGVAFSRNPLTGLTDVLIEAVPGTGDALVTGTETPERWVRHWGDWTQRPQSAVLPEATVSELADGVEAIAAERGEPVDVEWAWDGQAISWLQVRPMTSTDVPVYSNRISKEFLPGMIPPLVWSINVPIVNGAWLELFTSMVGSLDLEPEDLARQFAYRAYFNMGAVGDIFEAMSMPRDLLEVLMGIEGGEDRPTFRPRMGIMRHLPRMGRLGWRMSRYHDELDRLIPETQAEMDRLDARDLRSMSDQDIVGHLAELEAVVRRLASANIVAPLLFNAYGSIMRRRLSRRGIDTETVDIGAGQEGLEDYDPTSRLRQLAARTAELDAPTRARVHDGEVGLVPGMDDFLARFGHVSDSGNDFSRVPWTEDPSRLVPLLEADTSPTPEGNGSGLGGGLSRLDRSLWGRTARYRLERERVSYAYTRSYGRFRPAVLEIARRLVEREVLEDTDQVFYLTREEMEDGLLRGRTALLELATARASDMERLRDIDMPEVIFGDDFEPAPPTDPDHRLRGTPSSRGIVSGTARVISGLDEAARVQPGEILIIPYSDIGWTPLLARAGGIVAESGGLLSHSSIVAREFGIPCVVSVPGAMRVPDGSHVRIDGYTGEVQWAAAT